MMSTDHENDDALKAAYDQRAINFINEVTQDETVYVLVHEQMCVHTESITYAKENDEPLDVIPLWTKSYKEEATLWADGYGTLEEMPLAYVIEEFLPELDENDCCIGLNWDRDGVGREMVPIDFVRLISLKAQGKEITSADLDETTVEIVE